MPAGVQFTNGCANLHSLRYPHTGGGAIVVTRQQVEVIQGVLLCFMIYSVGGNNKTIYSELIPVLKPCFW